MWPCRVKKRTVPHRRPAQVLGLPAQTCIHRALQDGKQVWGGGARCGARRVRQDPPQAAEQQQVPAWGLPLPAGAFPSLPQRLRAGLCTRLRLASRRGARETAGCVRSGRRRSATPGRCLVDSPHRSPRSAKRPWRRLLCARCRRRRRMTGGLVARPGPPGGGAAGAAGRPGRVRLCARGRGERAHKAALQRAGPLRRRRRLGRRRLRARHVARQQREVTSRGGRRWVLRPRPRRAARRRRRARRGLHWRRRARRRELPGRLPSRGGRRDEPRRRRSWQRRGLALLRSRLRLCQRRWCCWAHCAGGLALPRQGQRRLSTAAALRNAAAAREAPENTRRGRAPGTRQSGPPRPQSMRCCPRARPARPRFTCPCMCARTLAVSVPQAQGTDPKEQPVVVAPSGAQVLLHRVPCVAATEGEACVLAIECPHSYGAHPGRLSLLPLLGLLLPGSERHA